MDRRLTPSNGRVAALHLKGTVEAERFVTPEPHRVAVTVADLRATPDGPRERQLLKGETFLTLECAGDMAFGYAEKDGYCGWIAAWDLIGAPQEAPTHRITVARSYGKSTPGLKTFGTVTPLSLGMALTVLETAEGWSRIAWFRGLTPQDLFVPERHLGPLDQTESDPVSVAERLIHTPYLWGGNSAFGIDCSGLVQMGCRLCGIRCPGDSDLQEKALGKTLPSGTPPERGDLMFWKGHVAWVADRETLLHANAFHMAAAFEPLPDALHRIAAQGDGPVTRHARLT